MRFKSEDEAWEYWEEAYYFSGGGYEAPGRTFNQMVDMFHEWVDDQGVTWLDEDLADWLEEIEYDPYR